jgi:hypothetical protein
MSDLLDIYQENIKNVFSKISKILENLNMYSSEKAESAINEAEAHLKEADRLIKNMELQSLTSKSDNLVLKNYKNGYDSYKKKISKAKDSQKLDSLILNTDSSTQKEKLINNEELMWSSFDKLQTAKRTTIELENVSIEVSRELQGQSEKMKGIDKKVQLINNDITTSTGLIGRMLNLQRRNKIIIALAGISLFSIFIIIFILRFTSGKTDTTTSNKDNQKIPEIIRPSDILNSNNNNNNTLLNNNNNNSNSNSNSSVSHNRF